MVPIVTEFGNRQILIESALYSLISRILFANYNSLTDAGKVEIVVYKSMEKKLSK